MIDLGEQVSRYRKEAGLSQQQLGDKINMSRQNISQIEKGKVALSGETIVTLFEVFGISPNQFFEYKGMKSIEAIIRNSSLREKRIITQIANIIDENYKD